MLYLFAGRARPSDVREHLQNLCKANSIQLEMVEYDILRGAEFDLSKQEVWDSIFAQASAASFDAILLSPPCGTFSRARFHFAGNNGPRPLRTRAHLRGFPWLRNSDLHAVALANFFIDKCIELAGLQASIGKYFIFELPSGDIPGSVWDFPSMRSLVETCGAATWPLHQCFFGADSAKPTRLASNLRPRDHGKPLLGRENNEWRTSAAAAYPPLFCDFLARMLLSALGEPRQVGQGLDSTFVHPAEALSEALLHSGQGTLPGRHCCGVRLAPSHQGTCSHGRLLSGQCILRRGKLGASRFGFAKEHLGLPANLCIGLPVYLLPG